MARQNHRPISDHVGFIKHKGKFIVNGRYKKYIKNQNKMARISRRINRRNAK